MRVAHIAHGAQRTPHDSGTNASDGKEPRALEARPWPGLGLRRGTVLDLVTRRGGALLGTWALLHSLLRAEGWTQV